MTDVKVANTDCSCFSTDRYDCYSVVAGISFFISVWPEWWLHWHVSKDL